MSPGQTAGEHWLTAVARAGGFRNAEALRIPATAAIGDAWNAVQETCGLTAGELAEAVARHFRLPVADLKRVEPKAVKLVPEKVARTHEVLPLREDYRLLVVATADPTNLEAEQAVQFASGRKVAIEVATPADLHSAILAYYAPDQAVAELLEQVESDLAETVRLVEEEEEKKPALQVVASGPVVHLTNVLFREALVRRASDIHLQPTAHGGVIRMRVDGVLRTTGSLPLSVLARVVSRIKIMGKLDIADHLRPQDGKARLAFGGRMVDLRISTVPTRHGEKAVVRILDPFQMKTLEQVGILEPELVRFRNLLSHREGIVVVTGPTGSGKTTTLYAALQSIHEEGINIMTVEDPIEYEVPGFTQIQVEPKQGVTFASALRAILRQDPDVILVGEIRDGETAQIAAQASMTGHLVLATLHTNDALATIGRLLDLGLERGIVAESLRGAVAQRLVRRLCPECKELIKGGLTQEEEELAEAFGVHPLFRAVGCEACQDTGYLGRLPLVEIVSMTPELQELILSDAKPQELERAARRGGMRSLREVGAARVGAGETTLDELARVLGDLGQRSESVAPGRPRVAKGQVLGEEEEEKPYVLLVDDDGATRKVARAVLESNGSRVAEAEDGKEALHLIRAGSGFSLVVLDLSMPVLGGREVLKHLRSSIDTAGLPVIVLTGMTDQELEYILMEEGADDYIRKPLDPRGFLTRVEAALRRAAS